MKNVKNDRIDIQIILVTDNNIDNNNHSLFTYLKKNHKDEYSGKVFVHVVNSFEALNTVQGLANMVKAYEGTGFIYVVKAEIKPEIVDEVIQAVKDTGLVHAIVSRDNTGWKTKRVNYIDTTNRVKTGTKIHACTPS
jgi:hypothetical protein